MAGKPKYSERSRASIAREVALRAERKTLEDKKAIAERSAGELDEQVKRLRNASLTAQDSIVDWNYAQALASRDAKLDLAKNCEEGLREKDAQIAALALTDEERRSRAEQQAEIEGRVKKRLEIARKIGAAVDGLLELLAEHQRQTAELGQAVAPLEIPIPMEGFDAAELLRLLPEGLAETSAERAGHFLGQPNGGKVYVVRAEFLEVPETLAHHGVYRFGEEIVLDPAEAAELLANDFAAPTKAAPWRRLPARVMTVDDFKRVTVQAEQKGVAAAQIVFEQDLAQDAADRRWYLNSGDRPVARRLDASRESKTNLPSAVRVSARALRNVKGPRKDEEHKAGDVIEGLTLNQVWGLATSGAAGPL